MFFPPGIDGILDAGGLYRMPVHAHDELETNIIVTGKGTYRLDDAIVPLEAGDVFWVFPGQPHQMFEASADLYMLTLKWRRQLVHRISHQGDDLDLWMRRPTSNRTIVGKLDASRLSSLVHLGNDVNRQGGNVKNQGLGYLLSRIWSESQATTSSAKRVLPAVIRRALGALRDSSHEVDARALAKDLGVSYSHLARLFKKETGHTLGEARNILRLQSFFEEFRGNATLLQAAMNAGFGSYVQFYRVFRQHYGEGPQDYLRRHEAASSLAQEVPPDALGLHHLSPSAG